MAANNDVSQAGLKDGHSDMRIGQRVSRERKLGGRS